MTRAVLAFVGGWVGVLVLALVTTVALGAFAYWWAPWKGEIEARTETQSGTSKITNYRMFFDKCGDIQADQANIKRLMDQWKNMTGTAASNMQITINARLNILQEEVSDYNALVQQSSENYGVGQFRDAGLPYHVDIDERVQCVSQ